MADVTYKCPSCGAYLVFDPDSQKWSCPFCSSSFDEKTLLDKAEQMANAAKTEKPETERTADGTTQVIYRCQSCGSQIMTDETTVATNCYYCHSPVVLEGKMTDDLRPDGVLPFSVSREKAVSSFMEWVRKKRFVPKGFFNQAEIETMNGVYYPHFVSELDVDGAIEGEGRNTSVTDQGKYIVTNTQHYRVRREADIHFDRILRPALSTGVDRKLSDGIHPFPLDEEKPFSGAYLSGFLAERRDIDAASIREDVENEVTGYVKPLLSKTLSYESYTVTPTAKIKNMNTRYVLLPTWVLTYPNKSDKQHPYYYAMNGRTGEVCGKLPIDMGKLCLTGLGVGLAAAAILCVLAYFLF